MQSEPPSFWIRVFDLLSSLKLAVVILLTLGGVLAAGTIVESLHDTDTARYYVYGTWWFCALLGMLGLNVFVSALSRWPWKRHHIGFLVTHLGILTILAGSLVTLLKGFEGQVILAEGESTTRMSLTEERIFLLSAQDSKLEEIPVQFRFQPPSAGEPFHAKAFKDLRISVSEFLPHAQAQVDVREGDGLINPALAVKLSGSRATVEEWAFSREPDRQRINLGPASVTYLELPDAKSFSQILKNPKARGPILWLDGQLIPVNPQLPQSFSLKDGRIASIRDYYPQAGVTPEGVVNISKNPINPALRIQIPGKIEPETHLLFSRFPELGSGEKDSAGPGAPWRLLYIPPELGQGKNEMALARLADGKIQYALGSGSEWRQADYRSGETLPTGWMDFQFQITQNLEKADIEKKFRRVSTPPGKEGPPPAIRLSVSDGKSSQELWLGRGDEQALLLGSRRFKIAYGLKSYPLGFEVKLNDFQMGVNEGTTDPASYESHVTVLDPDRLEKQDHRIYMNNPLKYGPFKLFQASYQMNPDGSAYSVLAAGYDPGVPLKYAGALVMISGIILMFFFRPVYSRKKRTVAATADLKETKLVATRLKVD